MRQAFQKHAAVSVRTPERKRVALSSPRGTWDSSGHSCFLEGLRCDSPKYRGAAETMHYRISLLHPAAVALALTSCCVCARDTNFPNGRQTAGALQHQRPEHLLHAGVNSGPPWSKRRRHQRSTASVPWLTLVTGLRGGGRGGAVVDVPRGGSVATGVQRSAKVS